MPMRRMWRGGPAQPEQNRSQMAGRPLARSRGLLPSVAQRCVFTMASLSRPATRRSWRVIWGDTKLQGGGGRDARALSAAASGAKSTLPPLQRPSATPSLDAFAAHLRLRDPTPLLLPSLVSSRGDSPSPHYWEATRSWSHIDDTTGRETLAGLRNPETESLPVEVEVGQRHRGYLDQSSWQKLTMPFGLFLDAFIARTIPFADPAASTTDLIGYVAQQDLRSLSPILAAASPSLPHPAAGPKGDREQWRCNMWIGPADTFTPLHRDPYENLFVQAVGQKRVHLFPPSAAPYLYLCEGGSQQNTSTIPTEGFLLSGGQEQTQAQYPDISRAADEQGACHTVLGPGDALYIPRSWLHCVSSLSTSASVNFWWR